MSFGGHIRERTIYSKAPGERRDMFLDICRIAFMKMNLGVKFNFHAANNPLRHKLHKVAYVVPLQMYLIRM